MEEGLLISLVGIRVAHMTISLFGNVSVGETYRKDLPHHQATMLNPWDESVIPHKEKKQVSGAPLAIIGISVDPNAMSFTSANLDYAI
jgi:hypothetical protein